MSVQYIFLFEGTTSYTSSLDENTEVENLAGHHLVITERDGSRKTLQKAASFVRTQVKALTDGNFFLTQIYFII